MAKSEDRLVHAQQRAYRARNRLIADLLAIKEWLMPRRLIGNLARKAKQEASDIATTGAEVVKARPALILGAATVAALFLARKPIARAFSRNRRETPTAPSRSSVKRARRTTTTGRAQRSRKAKP